MSGRRGGIPGPESRTGLVRPPAMSEAEFERRQAVGPEVDGILAVPDYDPSPRPSAQPSPAATSGQPSPSSPSREGRGRSARAKPAKPRRVQRMFALEEDLDKKLWLYAIHVGKDRSDVVNDLLRPVVASMVLYDSRDRRSGRSAEPAPEAEQGGE
jgi:hypothetical protein